MTASNLQIVTLYENGLTVDQIHNEFPDLDTSSIKAVLLANCPAYSQKTEDKEEEITDDEYKQFLTVYKQIALFGEHDHIREKALRRLMDEKKGRLDIHRIVKNDKTINVILFNQQLLQTRKARLISERHEVSEKEEETIDV